ncbi:MAG: sulfur carrier protein ThiS adenylyltransferase ThiF [Pseudomonadota bacterium]
MKIGIAGIGGIGSNVARLLAQAKVDHIKMVDFDGVEISNLNRQFYTISQAGEKKTLSLKANLLQIYPGMTIETVTKRMGPGDAIKIFSDCAIVVEGFDDKVLKKMIIEELSTRETILVSASGIAGTDMDRVGVKKMGNCHIVGDLASDQEDHVLFPPKIAMVSSLMAAIVLTHINGQGLQKADSKGELPDNKGENR